MVSGVKSFGIGLPLVWGVRAVPAVGNCAGVKKGTPLAGWVGTSTQAVIFKVHWSVRKLKINHKLLCR